MFRLALLLFLPLALFGPVVFVGDQESPIKESEGDNMRMLELSRKRRSDLAIIGGVGILIWFFYTVNQICGSIDFSGCDTSWSTVPHFIAMIVLVLVLAFTGPAPGETPPS